jgi:hypothetical protein
MSAGLFRLGLLVLIVGVIAITFWIEYAKYAQLPKSTKPWSKKKLLKIYSQHVVLCMAAHGCETCDKFWKDAHNAL